MTKLIPFLTKFGLFAAKSGNCDQFDLRLTRINRREARALNLGLTFRNQPSRRAGAVLS